TTHARACRATHFITLVISKRKTPKTRTGELSDIRKSIRLGTMSEVFEGYERQYCELSANLSRKCTATGALNGGGKDFS
ncbi:vesicle transport v-snare 12, partial [Quercus suber]